MKAVFPPQYLWPFLGITLLLGLICLMVIVIFRLMRSVYRREAFRGEELFKVGLQSLMKEMGNLREQIKVKERLAVLGELSASIIHQVRNPLAVIAGYARLIERSKEEDSQTRAYAKAILEEIESINQVMEGLISMTQTKTLDRQTLDIRSLIIELVEEIPKGQQNIHMELSQVYVQGDKVLLKQALRNIIQNALEAGKNIQIRAKVTEKGFVRIEVEDDGPGITEEEREKIFLPFFSKKDGSRGMGLTIAQKIIYHHDGTLGVSNSPAGGAVFSIELPREEDANHTPC